MLSPEEPRENVSTGPAVALDEPGKQLQNRKKYEGLYWSWYQMFSYDGLNSEASSLSDAS